jgi:hypothetical protein
LLDEGGGILGSCGEGELLYTL